MQAAAGPQRKGGVDIASSSQRGQPLPMPCPRTPPGHPDIHGRYHKQAELSRLTREIALLEEELRTLESLPPASVCCKEVDQFVETHSDRLLPLDGEVRRSFRLLKILDVRAQAASLCDCCFKDCPDESKVTCCSCSLLKNWRCSCWKWTCKPCCTIPSFSCANCSCFECSCSKCLCSNCSCSKCSCPKCSCPKCSCPTCSCFKCVKCCHPCGKK